MPPARGGASQLRLLLWKNWLLKKRAASSTLVEVLVPVLVVAILVIIRAAVHVDDVKRDDHASLRFSADTAGTAALTYELVCGPVDDDVDVYRGSVGVAPASAAAEDARVAARTAAMVREDLVAYAASLNETELALAVPCVPGIDLVRFANESAVREFPSEADMVEYIGRKHYGEGEVRPLMFGIVLGRREGTRPAAHAWDLTVRTNFSATPDTRQTVNKFITSFDQNQWSQYFKNGFVNSQVWGTRAVLEAEGMPASTLGDVVVGPFPEAHGRKDVFGDAVSGIIGLFMVIAFMWPFSRLVRNMVDEKERRVREGMMVMGLRNTVFWTSWALTYAALMFVTVILVLAISKFSLFKYADVSLLAVFWLLFAMTLISLAMLVTPFFQRAKTAGTLSMASLVIFVLPYFTVQASTRPASTKALACLLSPVAFALGNAQVLHYESAFIGVRWDNINELEYNFRMSTALVALFFDFWLYLGLAWYFDRVVPKEFGTTLPWHFPFHASYWCGGGGSKKKKKKSRRQESASGLAGAQRAPLLGDVSGDSAYGALAQPLVESPPATPVAMRNVTDTPGSTRGGGGGGGGGYQAEGGSEAGAAPAAVPTEDVPPAVAAEQSVVLRNLRKVFGSGNGSNVAVKGLDLSMYRGQMFVLLGHNGAGKSTTINMLTGMSNPTSGTATIEGYDLVEEMPEIRQRLGICPQHDILWPSLSVQEHLTFFAQLKGVRPGEATERAVREAMDEVQLLPQAAQASASLSGGQKRRLSLAMALIGDSQVVFLDEPTSGVDPYSRRAIWDLLTRKKAGRVIVLTTHFMDEADQLGDRIAIMHGGELRCVGSSLFLKRTYGVGYVMTLTKTHACDAAAVGEFVLDHVPSADRLTDAAAELSFRLPLDASSKFPALLRGLEKRSGELGIENYGLSVTTLEEVFLRVSEIEARAEDREAERRLVRSLSESSHSKKPAAQTAAQAHAAATAGLPDLAMLDAHAEDRGAARDFGALFAKRARIIRRDRKAAVCQFIVPIALLVFGLALIRIPPNFEFPNLELTASAYTPTTRTQWTDEGGPGNASALLGEIPPGSMSLHELPYSGPVAFANALLDTANSGGAGMQYGAYQVGAASAPYNYTSLNNLTAVHSMPTFVAEMNTAMLRQELRRAAGGAEPDPEAGIRTHSHPWPFTYLEKTAINAFNGVSAAITIAIAYAFVPASFCVYVVKDREQQSKHMQRISGVDMRVYWLANYAFDFCQFLVPALIGSWVILAFTNTDVYSGENYPVVVLSFLLYGLAIIPFTYLVSFLFKSHSTAQNTMIMIYFFGGVILLMTSFALYQIPSTREANSRYIRHLFRLLPSFCISDAFFFLSVRALPFVDEGPWSLDVSGYDCIFLAVEAVVYFALVLVVEHVSSNPRLARMFRSDPDMPDARPPAGDSDVDAERRRVQEQAPGAGADALRVMGLRKTFPGRVSVRDLWFGVRSGEVLGFLGVNGAGKSTTLKMLTSDYLPTRGTAEIGGFDLAREPEHVRRLTGYCSQADALSEYLSPREHLRFYAAVRGVPRRNVEACVSYLIDRLSLGPFIDRPAGKLSGGNKRKLSLAIALVGNPRVVLIDEMSSGVDAVSRRALWTFISETMQGRAVVLTTHSMEEAEALSDRIVILREGELVCAGTPQHLKHRYGRGLQLQISTGSEPVDQARAWVADTFEGTVLLESFGNSARFRLPEQSLAETFETIESARARVHIKEYALSQTSLEQIFLAFAQPSAPSHQAPPKAVFQAPRA